MSEINIDEIRKEVNPVYDTAHSCLQMVAATGDEDSENLRQVLGFSKFGEDKDLRGVKLPPEIVNALMNALPVFMALPEVRFFASNNYLTKNGAKTVVDLPSGYTARGIKLAKSGIKYYGLDLPAVIDSLSPAVKEVIGDNENVAYKEVDATNYSSLKKAIEGAEGEIYITTEGLLMYFTQNELETVFGNIRRLLSEYGGKWITIDNELSLAQDKAMLAVTTGLPKELALQIGSIAAGSASKTTLSNNIFFDKDREKTKKFVSDMGFDLELVSIKDYMPDMIKAIYKYPDDVKAKLQEAFEEINFWVMTPKAGADETFKLEEQDFKADVELKGDILNVALTGRLDTITSPGLLTLFKQAQEKGIISKINVDLKNLDYVSSAGLRVLLIMRKAVGDDNAFSLFNMNDSVKEIIETTGFDTIFC